jgi:hypothetical protein
MTYRKPLGYPQSAQGHDHILLQGPIRETGCHSMLVYSNRAASSQTYESSQGSEGVLCNFESLKPWKVTPNKAMRYSKQGCGVYNCWESSHQVTQNGSSNGSIPGIRRLLLNFHRLSLCSTSLSGMLRIDSAGFWWVPFTLYVPQYILIRLRKAA